MSGRSKTVVPFGRAAAMKCLADETQLEIQICDLVRACDIAEFVYHGQAEGKLEEGATQLVLEAVTQRAKDLKTLYYQLHDLA